MAFCPKCGAQLNEGARFCTTCGSQLGAEPNSTGTEPQQPAQQQVPQQPTQPVQQQVPQPAQQSYGQANGGQDYTVLGGWLLFFVICWGLSALVGIVNLMRYLSIFSMPGMGRIVPEFGSIVARLVSIGVSIGMVVLVVKRVPTFMRIYQILIIVNLGVQLIWGIVNAVKAQTYGYVVVGSTIGTVVGGVVGLALMTMYFCKSVRVRTYMGSTEYLDTALFKVGA